MSEEEDRPDESESASDLRVIDRRWWARSEDDADGADPGSGKPTYVEDLEKQLADKDELLKDYAARYKAAADDFERTRVRLRKEVAKDVEREKRRVLGSFLEVIDNLERAIEAARAGGDDQVAAESLLEGVAMVRRQFLDTLEGHGVTPIAADGQPFDPNLHDALSIIPVTESNRENMVIDVVKPGYQINDEILRPASVTVGKLTANE